MGSKTPGGGAGAHTRPPYRFVCVFRVFVCAHRLPGVFLPVSNVHNAIPVVRTESVSQETNDNYKTSHFPEFIICHEMS